jgi:uncharacterized protein (TIRG00374 family)
MQKTAARGSLFSRAFAFALPRKRFLVAFLVSVLIAALFLWFVDLDAVLAQLRRMVWQNLLAAAGMLICGYVVLAFRWRFLLGNRPGFEEAFNTSNIGNLVNSISPVPEVAVRVWLISRGKKVTLAEATTGILVERLLEQGVRVLALFLVLWAGYSMTVGAGTVALNAGLVLVGFGGVTWLVRRADRVVLWTSGKLLRLPGLDHVRADRILNDLMRGLKQAGAGRKLTAGWIYSLVLGVVFAAFEYFVLAGIGVDFSPDQFLAVVLLTLAVAPPSAPGMPGLYQATIVGALSLAAGFDPVAMTAFALTNHALQILVLAVLGSWGLARVGMGFREVVVAAEEVNPVAGRGPSPGADDR